MTMGLSSVKERQKQHWDTVAPRLGTWPEWTERNLQPMTSWLQQLTRPPARVLDVGCGAGYPALVLARAGGRVLATDLSRQMIGVASERARRERRDNIRFVQMDAEAVCFADSSFDVVTNIYSLMFCPDPERVVLEAHRLLVPGGRLAVATWAHPSQSPFFAVIREAAAHWVRLPEVRSNEPGPFRLDSPDLLSSLLERAGFTRIEVERVPMMFECDSLREYCQIFMDVALHPKAAALLASVGDGFQEAVAIAARPYFDRGRVRLVATTLRAAGRR